jgi:DNA polymerase-1
MPKELAQQISKVKEILKTFNVPIFEKENFEADDLIGTIASKNQGVEKIIVSGDLDNLQLVSKETKVFVLSSVKKSTLYDQKEVEKRYRGLKPEQIPDFKALVGDPSDNVPGVLGIGEKTAIELLLEFKNLENLYQEIETGSERAKRIKAKIRESLLKSKERAIFSKNLVQIKKDVAIDFDYKKCRWGEYDKEKVVSLLKDFEFFSLIEKLPNKKERVQGSLKL